MQDYFDRFQGLRTDRRADGTPRPHKAVMLLAVLGLADSGALPANRIVYGPELLEIFRRLFAVVRGPSDQCTPWNPFFYLRSEEFWHLHALPGQENALAAMGGPRGAGSLVAVVSHASLDDELFDGISQPVSRELLRTALIDRYCSAHRTAILALCKAEQEVGAVRETWVRADYQTEQGEVAGATEVARSTAFARTVRQAYDYRCAACGVRFLFESITIIDAAHLIPFGERPDNSPQNGIALCKNHHWLMDSRLIAPGPARAGRYEDLRWHVRKELDDRIEGQREVLALRHKTVLLPADPRLHPKRESLDRRMALLAEGM